MWFSRFGGEIFMSKLLMTLLFLNVSRGRSLSPPVLLIHYFSPSLLFTDSLPNLIKHRILQGVINLEH